MTLTQIRLIAFVLLAPLLQVQTPDPFLGDAIFAVDATVKPKVMVRQLPSYVNNISSATEGQFRVEFIVERNGSVKDARVVGGAATPRPYESQTLADIRRWKFQAGEKDGKAVRVVASMTVTFVRGSLPGRGSVREGVIGKLSLDGVDDDFEATGLFNMTDRPAGVTWPVVKKDVRPRYPVDDNKTVKVELELIVLTTGKVGAVQIVRSDDVRFNDEAAACARQWEFAPATKDGKTVPVVVSLVLEFRKH